MKRFMDHAVLKESDNDAIYNP